MSPYFIRTFDQKYLTDQFSGKFVAYTTNNLRAEYDQSVNEVTVTFPGSTVTFTDKAISVNGENMPLPTSGQGWRANIFKQKLRFETINLRIIVSKTETTIEHLDQEWFASVSSPLRYHDV